MNMEDIEERFGKVIEHNDIEFYHEKMITLIADFGFLILELDFMYINVWISILYYPPLFILSVLT